MKGQHSYGWLPDRGDQRDYAYAPPTGIKLPAEVDLRSGMPPVYNQMTLGSCTANAIAAHLDFNRHKQGEGFETPSRLFIYFVERSDSGTANSDSGATIRESVKAIVNHGACPESEWPYDVDKFRHQPPESCYKDAVKYEALQYQRVGQRQRDMQLCLAEGYPFVIGVTVYESFETIGSDGIMRMPSLDEAVLGGHALCVVGYKNINGSLYWIVRNSWSESFGDSGYLYMPVHYLLDPSLSSDFWTLRRVR